MLRLSDVRTSLETLVELASLRRRYDGASLDALCDGMAAAPIAYARDWAAVERVGLITGRLSRRLPLASNTGACLRLALVRYAVLRRRGLNVSLHLGVRPGEGELVGHAWLTLNGEPLWENPAFVGTFRETFRHPAARA